MFPIGLAVVAALLVPPDGPLTTAQAVREHPADGRALPRPVRLTGVVTYHDPTKRQLFVQDDTAGVFVMLPRVTPGLAAGDRAEVVGVTHPGRFAPCVSAADVRAVGTAPLPEPLPYDLSREDSRWLDAQWVSVVGRIEKVGPDPTTAVVRVRAANGWANLNVPRPGAADRLRPLEGRSVRVRGVCVPSFSTDSREVSGPPRILVPDLDHIRPLPAAADPVAPPMLADSLNRFVPSPFAGGRWVRVAGTVVGASDPRTLFVQDASGGVCARSDDPHRAAVGDTVDVVGLVRFVGRRVLLDAARVRVTGRAEPPAPVRRTAAELAAGNHFATLAELDAVVASDQAGVIENGVLLAQGDRKFDLLLPAAADTSRFRELAPGDRVRAVGVVGVHRSPADGGNGFLLLLRTPADLTVTARPPASWWTPQRVAAVVGGLAGVGLIGFVWVFLLRREVRRRTAEVRRSYERTAELEGQLLRAAKLEAVGRLAGGIAHDFNNLLTVINGCSELLGDLLPDDHPAKPLTTDVRKAGERAADLTRQLLLFSRQREVELIPLDVSTVVGEAARLVDRLVGERVAVVSKLGTGLPTVRADAGLLSQVVLNLAVNARDAMPDGGTLTLTTGVQPDGRVRLAVTDTGTGMPPEVQARIFEPFYTTKGVGQGTGLGLATVYGIVNTLGGGIRVQSAVGQGTTFEIDLPPADGPPSERATRPPIAGPGAGRVLVVEDDEAVRSLAGRVLSAAGFAVRAVGSAADADRLPADRPFDVLLADVGLPGDGGVPLAERLRTKWPGLRVLLMSGYPQDGTGADEVLAKPFTPGDLRAAVARVLAGSGAEM